MVRIFKSLSLVLAIALLTSCEDAKPVKPTVDWNSWGDEIVYNDTDIELSLTLDDLKGHVKTVVIAPAAADTLAIPSMEYSLCLQNAEEVGISHENQLLVSLKKGVDKFFTDYDYEEFEYTFKVDGQTWTEDRLWPRYRYHITNEMINR